MDPRFDKINELFINYSLGNFDLKGTLSPRLDEVDAFISSVNMLGEELKASTISKNYFNDIFHSIPDMLFMLDDKGNITNINHAVAEKLLYTSAEMKGYNIDHLLASGKSPLFASARELLTRGQPLADYETDFRTSANRIIPVYCTITLVYTSKDKNPDYLLVAKDLTRIREYQVSLLHSEEKYKRLFQESSDAVVVFNQQRNLIDFNKAFLSLFNYLPEDAVGMFFYDLYSNRAEMTHFEKLLCEKGSVIDFKTKLSDSNGNLIDCQISVAMVNNNNREMIGFQGIIKDIRKQKETEQLLVRTMVDTQEAERKRFAKDIHDGLGQQLSAIKFYLGALKKANSFSWEKIETILEKTNEALHSVINEVRNICFNLMPRTLEEHGLAHAINELCSKLEFMGIMQFEIDIEYLHPVDKSLEIAIFRLVQEFINNTMKHAQASQITVVIKQNNTVLHVILKDNGVGFNADNMTTFNGMGLRNVRSRVESYNGEVRFESAPGNGTLYKIDIPIPA